ncbi:MAG: TIGR00303 family protein [Synechococcales cyanobacterium T60_A2020_003]|nr:TIGR00303 family protein [Synechococcales cyanobacterium T60_A2020_003]
MIQTYTQPHLAQVWIETFRGQCPRLICVLGFTETGLIPGISAAGATPRDREFTALADAEFLWAGVSSHVRYPLPPLTAGASPVFISRAVVANQSIPVELMNAGLRHAPAVPVLDLGGQPARCVQTGAALPLDIVQHLFEQGLRVGAAQARQTPNSYLILSECVVGGTTTALAVLTGLGWNVGDKVNSSHPTCNHSQKRAIVQRGLAAWGDYRPLEPMDPLRVVAAVGDPMQIVVAGMAIAASRSVGVLLAGGTQMLAVYALMRAIATYHRLDWNPEQVVVGTTRWVAEDPTGDTVGLANLLDAPLIGSTLSFAESRFPQLQVYERGFVKEGVGAGGCAIAAYLYQHWTQSELLEAIEHIVDEYDRLCHPLTSSGYTASEFQPPDSRS